jgi:hypothetical protein
MLASLIISAIFPSFNIGVIGDISLVILHTF